MRLKLPALALVAGLFFASPSATFPRDADTVADISGAEVEATYQQSPWMCGDNPKNQSINQTCPTELELCLNSCNVIYDMQATYCSSMGFTPSAAICHAANSVSYGVCRSDCHQG